MGGWKGYKYFHQEGPEVELRASFSPEYREFHRKRHSKAFGSALSIAPGNHRNIENKRLDVRAARPPRPIDSANPLRSPQQKWDQTNDTPVVFPIPQNQRLPQNLPRYPMRSRSSTEARKRNRRKPATVESTEKRRSKVKNAA